MTDNKNSGAGIPDTGHKWDGNLRELTNQPPRWWMLTLYASGVFLVIYLILFPAIPLVNSATEGVLGWTHMKRLQKTTEDIEAIRAPFEKKLQHMAVTDILSDQELATYAVHSAKVLFGDRCAPCHGAGGAGNPGYPVLADDDWLYGGSIDAIQQTIANGRAGMMPGFGSMLNEQQLNDLTQHVLALSKGGEHAPGKELFMANGCIGCHGMDGKGLVMVGGANLTDAIWRFGQGTEESVKYTIKYGVNAPGATETREAVMPKFAGQLNETEIKKLIVYVHKLGGGQ